MITKRWLLSVFYLYCCISILAQTIENPVFDRTDTPEFHIDKIEITNDTTFVYCTCFIEAGSWANISPTTYIEDVETGTRYPILMSKGIPFAPQQIAVFHEEKVSVKLSFPYIKTTNKLNLIENLTDKAFNIYGINLKECNDSIYKNYSIEKAIALNSKADFYFSVKNYNKAIEYEEQAMNIFKYCHGRHNEDYDHTIFMLAVYYNLLGAYSESNKYLKESIEIRNAMFGEENITYITSLETYARNCISIGNIMEGISLLEKVINIEKKTSQVDGWQYTNTLIALAQAYIEISDMTRALQHAEEAYTILNNKKSYNDDFIRVSCMLTLIYMYNNIEKANEMCSKTHSIIKQHYGTNNIYYLNILCLMTNCAIAQKKSNEALLYAHEAKEISERLYDKKSLEYSMLLELLYQINRLLLHNYKEAINFKQESLDIRKINNDPIFYANELGHLADDYAKIKDYKTALYYTNIAINKIKEVIQDFEKGTIDQKYSLWSKFYRSIFSGYPLYVANSEKTDEKGNLYNNVLYFKGITSKSYNKEKCTWRDIQASLDKNDIAVEIVESIEKDSICCYYALIIKREYDSPKLFRLFDMEQFGNINQEPISFKDKCKTLGDYIWGSIRNELGDIKNIYFSPVGICQTIFIENLPYNEKEYYSDKYNMYRLSSTSVLVQERKFTKYKKAVLYGGLNYNTGPELQYSEGDTIDRSGFDYLYNTDDEVASISSLLNEYGIKNTIFIGENGTEKSIRDLSGQDFNILHIATHGMQIKEENVKNMKFNNNFSFLIHNSTDRLVYPSDVLSWSFMVLSDGNKFVNRDLHITNDNDGILTALEVADMDFHNIDLVVLSACESGLGVISTDNIRLGFQRGFKDAGANTILMTLNNVDDEATKILMIEFYKNLMSGKSKHQSLKDAQKHLRQVENGKYDILRYWASFVILDGLN